MHYYYLEKQKWKKVYYLSGEIKGPIGGHLAANPVNILCFLLRQHLFYINSRSNF